MKKALRIITAAVLATSIVTADAQAYSHRYYSNGQKS